MLTQKDLVVIGHHFCVQRSLQLIYEPSPTCLHKRIWLSLAITSVYKDDFDFSFKEEWSLTTGAADWVSAGEDGGVSHGSPAGQEEQGPGAGQTVHPHDEGALLVSSSPGYWGGLCVGSER